MNRKKKDGIFEKHHIVPKSCGGSNDASNLILLTPREHFIAHLLLIHIYTGSSKYKMIYAARRLAYRKDGTIVISARQYDYIKFHLRLTPIPSEIREKISNGNKGKKLSDEHKRKLSQRVPFVLSDESKKKISNSKKGVKLTSEHRIKLSQSHKGKILSDEHKIKLSNALKGKRQTKELIEKRTAAKIGKPFPEDAKRRISEKLKGRKISEEHKQNISKSQKGLSKPRKNKI